MQRENAFFRQAQELKLAPQELSDIRAKILARRPEEVLHVEEKDDIFVTLHSFTRAFPLRSQSSSSEHASVLTLWQGANLFRHLHPFVLA